jgi:hypothetical integral membrane protein (TIGR02206 family)
MQEEFILFGSQHISALSTVIAVSVATPIVLRTANNIEVKKFVSMVLAILLILHELIKPFYRYYLFDHELLLVFPIHICHLAAISMGLFLILKKEFLFEIAYFWGLSGNLLAMVTPDMKYGFPNLEFTMFYFGHGLLLLSILFACVCLRTNLRWSSILRVFIATILILPAMYGLNIALESYQPNVNYWYLMITPGPDTILSLFPEPPWHIPYVAVTALLIFIISFIPYKWLKG